MSFGDVFPPLLLPDPLYGGKLNPAQTAQLCGVKTTTLRQWRYKKKYLSYYKVGGCVWYPRAEVEAFVRALRVQAEPIVASRDDQPSCGVTGR